MTDSRVYVLLFRLVSSVLQARLSTSLCIALSSRVSTSTAFALPRASELAGFYVDSVCIATRGRVETNISPHGLLFFNGLWQRYISSRCVVFPTSFLQRRAEQRRVFALPCVHPRAGRQCIALTKRKACRASLLWAKRRRGGAVWSNLTSTKAVESKAKLKLNH